MEIVNWVDPQVISMEICKAGVADMIQVANIYKLREYVNNKNTPVFNYY